MGASAADDLTQRVWHATQLVDAEENMRPHWDWVVGEMLATLTAEDLTTTEIAGLAVILAQANARKQGTSPTGDELLDVLRGLPGTGTPPVRSERWLHAISNAL